MNIELSDFLKAPNQGDHPELYEIENAAIDREGTLFAALENLASWEAKTLLDLGCGTGFWLPKYRTLKGNVIGVEPDVRLLPQARARDAQIPVLHGSAEHLPLEDSSVDVVHARFAYFFPSTNYDCTAGLAEVLRILKPGGSLVVIDNDHLHGEFAQLLARSSWAASQGEEQFIKRWWASQHASRHEVMSSWTFDSATDLQRVLRMEFPEDVAQAWITEHPERSSLSYSYELFHITKR